MPQSVLSPVSALQCERQPGLRATELTDTLLPGPPLGLTTYPLLFSGLNGLFAELVSFEEILGEAESKQHIVRVAR